MNLLDPHSGIHHLLHFRDKVMDIYVLFAGVLMVFRVDRAKLAE